MKRRIFLLTVACILTAGGEIAGASVMLPRVLSMMETKHAASVQTPIFTPTPTPIPKWYGDPAIWEPPPITNATIERFDLIGTTQRELINSLNTSPIASQATPDPANPGALAWGLAGFHWDGGVCYSPKTANVSYQITLTLPRWSPAPDGTVDVQLIEAWNALEQSIYVHEAGHAQIDTEDMVAINDHVHQLPNCSAVVSYIDDPTTHQKINDDQNAYHARLRADCRPEIGCIPRGWLGW